jgi:hypothetical protein
MRQTAPVGLELGYSEFVQRLHMPKWASKLEKVILEVEMSGLEPHCQYLRQIVVAQMVVMLQRFQGAQTGQ